MAVEFEFDLLGHIKYVFKSISSDSPNLQFSGFLLLNELVKKHIEVVSPYLPQLHAILHQNLSSSLLDIKLGSLNAAIQVIPHMLHFLDSDQIKDWEVRSIQTLLEGLSAGQVSSVEKVFMSLNELAESQPLLLTEQFFDMVLVILDISELHALDDGTRNQALELLITLVEAWIPDEACMQFYQRLFKNLINHIYAVGATSSKSEIFKELLSRLALVMGEEDLVQIASEELEEYISAPESEKRFVAIEAIVQIAEGCSMVGMQQMVTVITNSYSDNNPKIQLASMCATLQLQINLGEKFQACCGQQVLHAIEQAMDHFQTTESKDLAESALLQFKGG